jgi:membrane-associated protease RseP (regulator of RpoE activity)
MNVTTSSQPPIVQQLRQQLQDVMAVEQVEVRRPPAELIAFRGPLYTTPEEAFERVFERFENLDYTAMLAEDGRENYQIVAAEGVVRSKPGRSWVNIVLFLITVLTTMMAGLSSDINPLDPRWYISGLPFAVALLGILLAHELSHYFVARRYGSPVSLPYFVPMPVSILGTMGAVILQRAPMRDRKALFDIGIAGPLAGFIVAVPLLIVGLLFTQVGHPSEFMDQSGVLQRLEEQCERAEGVAEVVCEAFSGQEMQSLQEGNSILYLLAKYTVFGRVLPDRQTGEDVWLSQPVSPGGPIVFAAWAGLFVTALNLLPIGQLDGGHVTYALLGRRAWVLAYVVVAMLAGLGIYLLLMGNPAWPTWIIWAGLAILLGPRHPPPLNDATRVGTKRTLVGILMLVIFVLTFVPIPIILVPAP